jgi:hypothetical protein
MVEDYARRHPHRRVAIKLHPASRAYGFSPFPIQHAHIVTADSLALIRSARVVLVVASTAVPSSRSRRGATSGLRSSLESQVQPIESIRGRSSPLRRNTCCRTNRRTATPANADVPMLARSSRGSGNPVGPCGGSQTLWPSSGTRERARWQ